MQRRFQTLVWTAERIDKIEGSRGHGVTTQEVEDAFYNDETATVHRARSGRYVLAAQTSSGRRLIVIVVDEGRGRAGPISARDPDQSERRRYFG